MQRSSVVWEKIMFEKNSLEVCSEMELFEFAWSYFNKLWKCLHGNFFERNIQIFYFSLKSFYSTNFQSKLNFNKFIFANFLVKILHILNILNFHLSLHQHFMLSSSLLSSLWLPSLTPIVFGDNYDWLLQKNSSNYQHDKMFDVENFIGTVLADAKRNGVALWDS